MKIMRVNCRISQRAGRTDRPTMHSDLSSSAVTADFKVYATDFNLEIKETTMSWTTPAFTDMRFGFEVTMYIANR
jgi:coenzyme PQQ precursor peptide PqqA